MSEWETGRTEPPRRRLMSGLSKLAMAVGLVGGYGVFAGLLGRFLYPSSSGGRGWMLIAPVNEIRDGAALNFETPSGAMVVIARNGRWGDVGDFIALSSICPHLGCQVHWEPHNNRFFCPCHNGVFTPQGVAVEGPPAKEGQSLPRFPLKVERGLLYIEVSNEELALGKGRIVSDPGSRGPGHDPCLQPRKRGEKA